MAKKPAEAFDHESKVLSEAKSVLESGIIDIDQLKPKYAWLCDEYEKLVDEMRFLTKVSDKLEAKLNEANEKLRAANDMLNSEVIQEKTEKEKVLKKNKSLSQEKTELDKEKNKSQLTTIILVVIIVILVIMFVYYVFIKEKDVKSLPHHHHNKPHTTQPASPHDADTSKK